MVIKLFLQELESQQKVVSLTTGLRAWVYMPGVVIGQCSIKTLSNMLTSDKDTGQGIMLVGQNLVTSCQTVLTRLYHAGKLWGNFIGL